MAVPDDGRIRSSSSVCQCTARAMNAVPFRGGSIFAYTENIHTCIYTYICMYMHMYTCFRTCIKFMSETREHTYIYIYIYMCIYTNICVCLCVLCGKEVDACLLHCRRGMGR